MAWPAIWKTGDPLNAANLNSRFEATYTWPGNVNANGNKLTGLGAPTNNTDAATKQYVDTAVASAVGRTLREQTFTGSTSSSITLSHTPLATTAFMLFKNGMLLIVGTDFTRTDTAVTLSHARTNDDVFRAVYYS